MTIAAVRSRSAICDAWSSVTATSDAGEGSSPCGPLLCLRSRERDLSGTSVRKAMGGQEAAALSRGRIQVAVVSVEFDGDPVVVARSGDRRNDRLEVDVAGTQRQEPAVHEVGVLE